MVAGLLSGGSGAVMLIVMLYVGVLVFVVLVFVVLVLRLGGFFFLI